MFKYNYINNNTIFRYQSIRRTITQEPECNMFSRTDSLYLDSSNTKYRDHENIALQFISKREFPTLLQQNQVLFTINFMIDSKINYL